MDSWIAHLKRESAAQCERKRTLEKLKQSERTLAEDQEVAHIGSWEREDVTELRRAEQELRRQKMVLQTICDHIPLMVNFVDLAGQVQMVNKYCERVLGWSMEEPQTRDLAPEGCPDPEDRARVLEFFQHPTPESKELTVRTRDGRMIVTSWLVTSLPDGMRIWFGEDVTERKRTDEALSLFRDLIDHTNDAFEVIDAESGRFLDVNQQACIAHGYTREEYLELSVSDIDPLVAKRTWQKSAEAVKRVGTCVLESQHRHKNGSLFPVEVNATYIRGDRDYILAVVRDITGRKRAEELRRESADRLQQLSRRLIELQEEERRRLARELHDEFGQILAAITLHLHAARSLSGEAAVSRLDECAALLQQAGEQVRSLALELRPPMLDTLGLEATLRWLAKQHEKLTGGEAQVVGRLSGTPLSPDLTIACFRVAQEALTNIVRHADARHVGIDLSQSESMVELVVRDDGRGFDKATTLKRAAQQGRLGLLGMLERIQILGGSLDVDSQLGQGTRIRATFPWPQPSAGAGESIV